VPLVVKLDCRRDPPAAAQDYFRSVIPRIRRFELLPVTPRVFVFLALPIAAICHVRACCKAPACGSAIPRSDEIRPAASNRELRFGRASNEKTRERHKADRGFYFQEAMMGLWLSSIEASSGLSELICR
jgi:hypothetical protein